MQKILFKTYYSALEDPKDLGQMVLPLISLNPTIRLTTSRDTQIDSCQSTFEYFNILNGIESNFRLSYRLKYEIRLLQKFLFLFCQNVLKLMQNSAYLNLDQSSTQPTTSSTQVLYHMIFQSISKQSRVKHCNKHSFSPVEHSNS